LFSFGGVGAEYTNNSTTSNEQSSRNSQSHRRDDVEETTHRSTQSQREETEKQHRFSLGTSNQQEVHKTETSANSLQSTFDEGYQLIVTTKEKTWETQKSIEIQIAVNGSVEIQRGSRENPISFSILKILRESRDWLEQIYEDYHWNFDQGNTVSFSIFGQGVERHKHVIEKVKEHPLHRIKRLLESLVEERNKERRSDFQPLWVVNITVKPDSISPKQGEISIHCNDHIDTDFLNTLLLKATKYSDQEALEINTIPDGRSWRLIFSAPQELLEKDTSRSSIGLRRSNSGYFSTFFGESARQYQIEQTQKNRSAEVTFRFIESILATNPVSRPDFEIREHLLKVIIYPGKMKVADKIFINSLRLTLADFFKQITEEEPFKLVRSEVDGKQYFFTLDFNDVKKELVHELNKGSSWTHLLAKFQDTYNFYENKFSPDEAHELKTVTNDQYKELQESVNADTESESLDF
jgi:hypothetical protein